jgi:protein gp37
MRFLSIEPLLEDLGRINLKGISWVIVGGESGNACPEEIEWVGIRIRSAVRSRVQETGSRLVRRRSPDRD